VAALTRSLSGGGALDLSGQLPAFCSSSPPSRLHTLTRAEDRPRGSVPCPFPINPSSKDNFEFHQMPTLASCIISPFWHKSIMNSIDCRAPTHGP
jgi:hypothetical protein